MRPHLASGRFVALRSLAVRKTGPGFLPWSFEALFSEVHRTLRRLVRRLRVVLLASSPLCAVPCRRRHRRPTRALEAIGLTRHHGRSRPAVPFDFGAVSRDSLLLNRFLLRPTRRVSRAHLLKAMITLCLIVSHVPSLQRQIKPKYLSQHRRAVMRDNI